MTITSDNEMIIKAFMSNTGYIATPEIPQASVIFCEGRSSASLHQEAYESSHNTSDRQNRDMDIE
jgi:hypothetical protein